MTADISLADHRVGAAVAVSDMDRAREFYEGKLGLRDGTGTPDNLAYECGEGTLIHVYVSPNAGTARSTVAGWGVDDIEAVVDALTARGVVFERYDQPPIVTDDKGIATFAGNAKVAYFADPDGNILSVAQAPRAG
jgi:catechol 2,3-dioxygenase-like lactoylglutathione lyase family enzyme